jgi:uncharacterized protein (TIGR02145 family)
VVAGGGGEGGGGGQFLSLNRKTRTASNILFNCQRFLRSNYLDLPNKKTYYGSLCFFTSENINCCFPYNFFNGGAVMKYKSTFNVVGVVTVVVVLLMGFGVCAQKKSAPPVSTFTDTRDGKVYKKVTVGSQTWMAENLNYETEDSECYMAEEDNCEKYGRLYMWETALKACPAGWHLPLIDEWKTLTDYVGYDPGAKLKSIRGWKNEKYKVKGTDDYGFAALPGGELSAKLGSNGEITSYFHSVGEEGYWWSATEWEDNASYAKYWNLRNQQAYPIDDIPEYGGMILGGYKISLYSVRCVQNQ